MRQLQRIAQSLKHNAQALRQGPSGSAQGLRLPPELKTWTRVGITRTFNYQYAAITALIQAAMAPYSCKHQQAPTTGTYD
jgi:hypothetical protein